jgi:hypothetical protein
MKSRSPQILIKEITEHFTKNVSGDAKFTIFTIKNLIESNARVEESIDELHDSISKSNAQNEKLQKRIYFLTIVTVVLTLVQAFAVISELF